MNIEKYLTDHYKVLKYLNDNSTKQKNIQITLNDLEKGLNISRTKINSIKKELIKDELITHNVNTSKYFITKKGTKFLETILVITKIN